MLKKGCLVIFLFAVSFSFVSGVGVSLSNVNSTWAQVSISGASNLYSYEVDLDYTGSITTAQFYDFLSLAAGDTTNGHKEKNSISSYYESRLDSGKTSVSGSGKLFNVSHSGSVSLRYALFIYNDSTQEYVYYNESADTLSDSTTTSGGGGGGATTPVENIEVDLENIELYLVLNSYKERLITITNLGTQEKTISISHSGLDDVVVIKQSSFTLAPGQSKNVRILFMAPPETGITAGKLYVAGHEILVSVNTRTKELLFDAMVAIPDYSKSMKLGGKLDAKISLIPMGEDPRVDVTLNYLIKDFNGNIYLEESETILVESQKDFNKQFLLGNLPVGNYLVGLEVVYPNGVATSSSQFEVVEKLPFFNLRNITIMLGIGVFILIVLVIFFMIKYLKKRKRKRK